MALVVKNWPANTGDAGLSPGLGRSPRGGNSNPLQYSCLENPMDGGCGHHPYMYRVGDRLGALFKNQQNMLLIYVWSENER